MQLRKSTIHACTIGIGILLLALTYEIHIRQYYFEIVGLAGIATLVTAAFAFHTETHRQFRTKLACCILVVLLFSYPIAGYVIFGISESSTELLKPAIQMAICIALILITGNINNFLIATAVISAAFAAVSILIYAFGKFLLWEMFYNRSMSIFFDPNYAAALFGLGALSSLTLPHKKLSYTAMTLSLIGAVLAFSKATIIALLIATAAYIFLNAKKHRILIFTISSATISILSLYINYILSFLSSSVIALRIETGLNLRDIYWRIGLEEIIKSPLTLRSSADVVSLISPFGVNTSLHNTYIETAFLYGSFFCATLIFLSILSIIRYVRRKDYVLAVLLIYLMTSANNFTFMLGSPNIMSFAMSILIINGIIAPRHRAHLAIHNKQQLSITSRAP